MLSDGTYALVAAGAGRRLRETAAARRRLDRLSGGVFISLGLVAALAGEPRRSSGAAREGRTAAEGPPTGVGDPPTGWAAPGRDPDEEERRRGRTASPGLALFSAGREVPDARSASAEELAEHGRELLRRLLGHVVAAVDRRAADVVGPRAPDRDRIAAQVLEVVVDGPGDQRRAAHAAAGRPVGVVVRAVEPRPAR